MKKLLFSIVILFSLNIFSQKERRVITTAVPFLLISSDARASGVGEQGVATSFDNFSQHWNPSKYVFSENSSGFGPKSNFFASGHRKKLPDAYVFVRFRAGPSEGPF